MLTLISPAKSLDMTRPTPAVLRKYATQPQFMAHARVLNTRLREFDAVQLAQLMHVSDAIAQLNVVRNHAWREDAFDADCARLAVLAFDGDVYTGLDASHLSTAQLKYAQNTLRIVSGLYGLLRPLDWFLAYRLEMGTALTHAHGKNLYDFWGHTLVDALNAELATHKHKLLLNLASTEYFKAVPIKQVQAQVITPVFLDEKNGQYKTISFFAKRARGLMARYVIEHKIHTIADLQAFNAAGYVCVDTLFDRLGHCRLVFQRDERTMMVSAA